MSEFRRRLMAQVANDPNALPAGCVRLEYIEGTGTQWIDTEKVVYANEDIFLSFQVTKQIDNYMLFGWRWNGGSANTDQCYINEYLASGLILYYGTSANNFAGIKLDRFAKNTILISPKSRSIYINGVQSTSGTYDTTFSNAYDGDKGSVYHPMLMNFNIIGNVISTVASHVRIFEYALTDEDGNYTQHLVPILDPNDTPCMFDTVTKKFHYNRGTGQFKTPEQ